MSGDIFGGQMGGWGEPLWHLLRGDQGCWWTSCRAQHSAPYKELFSPNVDRVETEKLLSGMPGAFMQREDSRYQKNFISSRPSLSGPKTFLFIFLFPFPLLHFTLACVLDFLSTHHQHSGNLELHLQLAWLAIRLQDGLHKVFFF